MTKLSEKHYYVERYNACSQQWITLLWTCNQNEAIDKYNTLASLGKPGNWLKLRENKEIVAIY